MPQIWADQEEVIFSDGVPDDPKHIYELMMGALAEQRRSVVEYMVDGIDVLKSGNFPKSFDKIEAKSMIHDEITLRITKESMKLIEKLDLEVDAYSRNILCTPWSEVFKRMDSLIEKIQPFADLVDNVATFANAYSPPWSERLNELAKFQGETLSLILKCFEGGDPAGLSDVMTTTLIPLVKRIKKFFHEEVIPHLESSVVELSQSIDTSNA